ncbi:MAG: hypothetical protein GY847_06285 [Proteobacteria bacterium]|nr:hypothetical protein [Pseudomonadota bacterium]
MEKPINSEFLLKKIENVRDYKSLVDDSENFFVAQQLQEKNSARTIGYLESRIQLLEACQTETASILGGDLDHEKKLDEIEKSLTAAKKLIKEIEY